MLEVEVKITSAFPSLFYTYQYKNHAQETSAMEITSEAQKPSSESEHPEVTCHYSCLLFLCCSEPCDPLDFSIHSSLFCKSMRSTGPAGQPVRPSLTERAGDRAVAAWGRMSSLCSSGIPHSQRGQFAAGLGMSGVGHRMHTCVHKNAPKPGLSQCVHLSAGVCHPNPTGGECRGKG